MEDLLQRYPYLFPFFFAGLWVFVLSILSRMSGWNCLADYYRADGDFVGAKRHFQSASMGHGGFMDVNFSNCLTFGVDGRVLRLSILFPFRLFHPPLDIPLSELSAEPKKFLIFNYLRLQTSQAPEIKISISKRQARWIETKSSGAWPLPAGTR